MDDNIAQAFGLIDPRDRQRMAGLFGATPQIQQTPSAGLMGPNGLLAPARAPNIPPPGLSRDNRTLLQKLQDRLGAARDGLTPIPEALSGLLSSDDIESAHQRGTMDFGLSLIGNAHGVGAGNAPSFGQALQAGVGAARQGAEQSAMGSIQGSQLAQQMAQQRFILGARQAIGQIYGPQPDDSQGQIEDKMRKAIAAYTAVGDHQSLAALKDAMPQLFKERPVPKYEHVDMGDKIGIVDQSGQVVRTYPKGRVPMSPEAQAAMETNLGLRQDAANDREDNRKFTRERALVQQYEGATKPITDATQALQTLYSMKDGALAGNAMAQQNALLAFIKLQHPGAVVRPSEIHTYASLMGLGDKAEQLIQKLQKGTPLSQTQIASIYAQVNGLHAAWKNRYDTYRKDFVDRASQFGIDSRVFTDPFATLPAPSGSAAPSATSSASIRQFLPVR